MNRTSDHSFRMQGTAHAMFLAVAAASAVTGPTAASFQSFAFRNDWRAAVGTPTTYLSAAALVPNATVDPEMWASFGVHMVASGPLTVVHSSGAGNAISSPFGVSFDIVFDQPINALYSRIGTSTGALQYWMGDTYVGAHGFGADGQLGVISSLPFDRIRISDGQLPGYVWNIEFGQPVPGPGAAAVLALMALTGVPRRRRA